MQAVLGGGAALAGHSAWFSLLAGCSRPAPGIAATRSAGVQADWKLRPVRDPVSGLDLLELPEGFRYFSFGWAGTALDDGVLCPPAADGMGVVSQKGSVVTLVRNQEIWIDVGAFGLPDSAWDPGAGGGTTTLELDLKTEKLRRAYASLTGTCANCSGGVTPWGSWLSCEEQVIADHDRLGRFARGHGYVFDVPGRGLSDGRPLRALGQFRHEAVAVDTASGIVYLTEDRDPESGFYRFLPKRKGDLSAGKLQMLAVRETPAADLRGGFDAGTRFSVHWVDIPDPSLAHASGRDEGGVVAQGIAAGGARFLRLEGIYERAGAYFFTSTSGGAAGAGQVWSYRPRTEQLTMVYESPAIATMDYPDQLATLGEALVICQDSKRTEQQVLYWLKPGGTPRQFARNNVEIEGRNYRMAEWSGVCTSADGRWLFANIYSPGFSIAITGPWDQLR